MQIVSKQTNKHANRNIFINFILPISPIDLTSVGIIGPLSYLKSLFRHLPIYRPIVVSPRYFIQSALQLITALVRLINNERGGESHLLAAWHGLRARRFTSHITMVILPTWAMSCVILGLVYGFRRRRAGTLDGYLFPKLSADCGKNIGDLPAAIGPHDKFYKNEGL